MEGQLRSIDNLIWATDANAATIEISNLQALDATTQQTQEIDYYVQLKNMEIDLLNSNCSYDDLTAGEISKLQNLALQSSARAGIQAQNWLHLLGISESQNEAYWGSSTSALVTSSEEERDQLVKSNLEATLHLRVQPNPSSGIFQFHLAQDLDLMDGHLRIYNLNGQLQYEHVLAESKQLRWQPLEQRSGFYFFVLQDKDGELLQQGKLVYLPK